MFFLISSRSFFVGNSLLSVTSILIPTDFNISVFISFSSSFSVSFRVSSPFCIAFSSLELIVPIYMFKFWVHFVDLFYEIRETIFCQLTLEVFYFFITFRHGLFSWFWLFSCCFEILYLPYVYLFHLHSSVYFLCVCLLILFMTFTFLSRILREQLSVAMIIYVASKKTRKLLISFQV